MRPWQVPEQGLNGCARGGGERFTSHSSLSSRHSWCAHRVCCEELTWAREKVFKPSAMSVIKKKKKALPQTAHLKRLTPLYKKFTLPPNTHTHPRIHMRILTPDSMTILRIPTIPRYLSWLFPT